MIEESAQVDGQILSEVVIPMMNVSRRAAFGAEDPNDITNKAQLYITTAGDKGTYAYDKLIQFFLCLLCDQKKPSVSEEVGVKIRDASTIKNRVNSWSEVSIIIG